jgi:hypothetical protein
MCPWQEFGACQGHCRVQAAILAEFHSWELSRRSTENLGSVALSLDDWGRFGGVLGAIRCMAILSEQVGSILETLIRARNDPKHFERITGQSNSDGNN